MAITLTINFPNDSYFRVGNDSRSGVEKGSVRKGRRAAAAVGADQVALAGAGPGAAAVEL